MGNFQQHITCSTLTGIVIGTGVYYSGFPISVGLVSVGLCSMAGMLPDIDSSSSRSFHECIYFAAGLCAVMIVERMRFFGFDHNAIILSGGTAFLFVRFAIGGLVKKLTVHRGMFHSIPAAILTGELIFCLSSGEFGERIVKSLAITVGYLSHLILDEICSIDHDGKKIKFKQSFGTALKFYDSKHIFNVAVLYILVFFIGAGTIRNSDFMTTIEQADSEQNIAENISTQSENKNLRKSIRNLIRYLAGFEDKRYSDKNRKSQNFDQKKNIKSENKSNQEITQSPNNSVSPQSQTRTIELTASASAQISQKTQTTQKTQTSSIPLSPDLLKLPDNLTTRNSDVQIFTQYRNRRNRKNGSSQTNQTEIIPPDAVTTDSDKLPIIIPQEDNFSTTNYIDNELVPLDVIDRNTTARPRSILPNRLPAPLNRSN
ncbi:MAG: metal-dependent hydrolase [Planctomycetaceae bacterium]|nr:metal-dependent hydrolase [Planctomycetaceae bacterium]